MHAISAQSADQPTWTSPIVMSLLGACAGLVLWIIADFLPDVVENPRLILWLGSAAGGFFIALLALLGVLRPKQALAVAGFLGLTLAALVLWHNLQFQDVETQFESVYPFFAYALLLLIGVPFGAAVMQNRVRDYTYLFDLAWGIIVRFIASMAFYGLFWALLALSNALLEIVGIPLLDFITEFDPVVYILSGAVFGLALSVSIELRAYVSPYLVLRLLRLLLPLVLVVVVVFLVALPFQGLSSVFGDFSAAGILMGIAIVGIKLITSALDRDDEDAVSSRKMVLATKLLAAILPILAAIAAWAVWVRVAQYGWTPERLLAAISAAFVLAYALAYAGSLLRGQAWAAFIRQSNIFLSLAVMAIAAVWLTPILNAEKISANSQFNRYLNGESTAEELPAWELQNKWGNAGREVAAQILDLPEDKHADAIARVDFALDKSKWAVRSEGKKDANLGHAQKLLENLTIWPEGTVLEPSSLTNLYSASLKSWAETCSDAEIADCALVLGPFAQFGQPVAVMSIPAGKQGKAALVVLGENEGGFFVKHANPLSDGKRALTPEQMQALAQGEFKVAPATRQSLWIGDLEISPNN